MIALEASGETPARVARGVEAFEDQSSFSRSFAYATGPALGLLLDRYDAGWRKKVQQDANLGELLGAALNCRAPQNKVNQAQARAERYGYRAVSEDEHSRAVRTQAILAAYRARFVDGPVLEFPKQTTCGGRSIPATWCRWANTARSIRRARF